MLQRPQLLQAPGSSLISRLVDSAVDFKDQTLITDNHIVMSEVNPKVSLSHLTLCLLKCQILLYADDFYKHCEPRSGPTESRA